MPKVGLLVNPVAGMGGKVGLKGTDGPAVIAEARRRGARPVAPERARQTLQELHAWRSEISLYAGYGPMGQEVAEKAGFKPAVVGKPVEGPTTAQDTVEVARRLKALGVDLLLFVGGDGTARDIFRSVGSDFPVLGVPAGVKLHSAVFAVSPRAAGRLARTFLRDGEAQLRLAEVMDIDEDAFRQGRLSAGLFGFLLVPHQESLIQGQKSATGGEEAELDGAAEYVAAHLEPGILYIVGPGTTTSRVMRKLNLPGTLLGVDAVCDGALVAADVDESRLLDLLQDRPGRILVTVIGGQGYVFGRGNQQISGEVIKRVGRDGITVVASKSKMAALEGRPLLADTGDQEADALVEGYLPVITGYGEELVYRLEGLG